MDRDVRSSSKPSCAPTHTENGETVVERLGLVGLFRARHTSILQRFGIEVDTECFLSRLYT